ncbi:hypothetical protein QSH18_03325 [Xanthomonas sp. NCPPB 2654]|uniref:hypothetical protein n=1 Tax=unclassified Xanthomonas TaxID=2643310 RepID=UPI0021E06535|nr:MULTISPECIES: hypothetical protein [unclassified Xanthomonas]MDL5364629.1 hypothetical protein [Xanthomonas sp. NCPPB 2654]UYC21943.1 hypothetical protein NUG20_06530 [Xanthomonas sp. CFBP 8443]
MTGIVLSVLDHAPHDWYLLQSAEEYFLDVNCSASWLGYSLLIRLDAAERADVLAGGRAACDRLAGRLRDTASPRHPRDVSRDYGDAVSDAIARWRKDAEG